MRSSSIPLLALVASATGCLPPPGGPADPKSVAVYDVARDEFQKGHLREALAKVQEAMSLDSGNADAAYLGAIIHLAFCARDELGADCRLEEAERYARRSLSAQADMRDARNTLGVVLVHQKKYAEAVEVLTPLTEDILYGSPEKSWGNLGWAQLEAGHADLAIDALRRSVAAQPGFCVGNFRLALAYEKKGDPQAAREAFTRALETERAGCNGIQDAWEGRARVAIRLGMAEQARGDLSRCAELSSRTESGKRCAAQLKNLPPASRTPEPETAGPAPPAVEILQPSG